MTQASEQVAAQFVNAALNKRTWGDISKNVKAYGAKGDGVSDDTASVQAAFSDAGASGGVVHFPEGTYLITSTITLPRNISFYGANQHRTIIKAGNGVVNLFEAKSPDYVQTQARFHMEKIQLSGTGTTAQRGIYIQAGKNIRIENCWFNGFQKEQLFLDQCFDSTIEKTYFYAATNTGTEPLVRLYYGTIDNVNEIHFDHCVWEEFARVAVKLESGPGNNNKVNEIYFDNCKWESQYQTNHIEMTNSYHCFFSNFNFCMKRTDGATPVYAILMDGCKWIHFTNGFIEWFKTGTVEPPFIGMRNTCKAINVTNVGMLPTDANMVPLWDIDGTTAFIQSWGVLCGDDPSRKTTNAVSQNYFTKAVNVQVSGSEPYVSVYRPDANAGSGSRWYMGRVTSTGQWRLMESETVRLYIHDVNKRVVPMNGIQLDSAWNGAALTWLGTYALWIDATGRLRIKNGTPASDTDGTVVGTQT